MRTLVCLFVGLSLTGCLVATPDAGTPAKATGGAPASGSEIPAAGAVPLTIYSPEDDATVNLPEVEVIGNTVPDGVVTLNDEIAVADAAGDFSAVVPLAEGPNLIEIVASDLEGNTIRIELVVSFDPAS